MKCNWRHLDKYRDQKPPYTSPLAATYGAFTVPVNGIHLRIIATDGGVPGDPGDWEHVSVHAYDTVFNKVRTPTWKEMCYVKDLFWSEDEIVVQYHPAKSEYVNIHDHVLHLWKPKKLPIPMPPKICV